MHFFQETYHDSCISQQLLGLEACGNFNRSLGSAVLWAANRQSCLIYDPQPLPPQLPQALFTPNSYLISKDKDCVCEEG